MAAEGEGDPLLVNEDEVWEDLDDLEGQVTQQCTVEQLLREHPQDIIKYVQTKGVAKLGELTAPDSAVFSAFQQEQIITTGSNTRKAAPGRLWRPALLESKGAEDVSDCGWSRDMALDALVVTIKGVAAPGKEGLLRPLLRRFAAKRCSSAVFALPAVQAVIHFKWEAFARRLLLTKMAFFMAWGAGFTAFTTFIQGEETSLGLLELLHTPKGRLSVASELVALVGMVPSLGTAVCMLRAYRWHWLDAWHMLSIAAYAIQVAVTVMHLGRWGVQSNLFTALLAVQFVILVLKLQYFTAALRDTKFSFLDTVAFVLDRIKWYLVFLVLMIWAFGGAFHVILRGDPKGKKDYGTMLQSFMTVFEHQEGDLDLEPLYESSNPVAALLCAVALMLVVGMILTNMLVALIWACIDQLQETQEMKLMLNKARIIDELEESMPRWLSRRHRAKWHPPYVHILRINPDKLDDVDVDALWAQLGPGSPAANQATNSQQRREKEGDE